MNRSASTWRLPQAAMLVVLMSATLHWSKPLYNWDMIPYIAVAHQFGGASIEDVHRSTYESIRGNLDPRTYDLLVDANEYRRAVARDARVLNEQLPFYRVKPAYPWLIHLLRSLGLDSVSASLFISRAAYLALGVALFVWLVPIVGSVWGVVVAWGLTGLPFVLELAGLSTPDALSTLVVVLALWLVFDRHRPGAGLSLLVLSILVRPDDILWLLVIAVVCAVATRTTVTRAAGALCAGGVLYFALTLWADSYGWSALFYHSFIDKLTVPSSLEPTLTPLQYARVYLRQTHPANLPPYMLLFLLIGGVLLVSRMRSHDKHDQWLQLLVSCACFSALHWIAYPADDRFLVAGYLVTLVTLTQTLVRDRAESRAAVTPVE